MHPLPTPALSPRRHRDAAARLGVRLTLGRRLGFLLTAALAPAGCETSSSEAAAPITDATATDACSAPLVVLRTGTDSACGGVNEHRWPIGLAATDCHGWRATDTKGDLHDNSANQIKCNADGSFTFTQFPGNLNCTGTGNVKTYKLNVCEQDTPPMLYTKAVDLTCCSDPSSAACKKGVPSVGVAGATITLNGASCTP